MRPILNWDRQEDCREDVFNDSDGTVTFNYLQQHHQGFDDIEGFDVLELTNTTDPHGITDGAVENQ